AGASLEALAKGAVQFSRRFTIRELQERWHALLYDPVVSADAASRMVDLERSNPNILSKFGRARNSKENKSSLGKRNAEKVYSAYHSLRKKFRLEPFSSMDLAFLLPPNDNHFIGNGNATHLGLEESHMDIIHKAFPEILADEGCVGRSNNPIEDSHPVQADNSQGEIPHVVAGDLAFIHNAGSSGYNAVHEDSKMKLEIADQEPKTAMPSADCFLAELSNSLVNDVDPFMDVRGKDIDKSYYDGFGSLLVNATNNTKQGALPSSNEQKTSAAQNKSGDASPGDHETSELDGTTVTSSSEVKPVSDSLAIDPHPEIVNDVICCGLNTEYPKIPCNDDVFLSNNCHP
ncbi:PREDICTED: uncharacterized protein LOC104810674, partial [Tarenaya hassleriana]|uniref:uncharacterized protein LOC104810674 n=1 Tax=Tarenaya hassleriana TaxID=28532 RepID=UPI00053C88F2